jgi:tRNA-splicing ligase RtcB
MKSILKRISPVLWEISSETRKNMRVPAHIYVSEDMLDMLFKDKSIEQLINVTSLPGIVNYAVVMPDVHEGYGFPIGAVVATDYFDGVISPGGIGYDINCGIRLLKSDFDIKSISKEIVTITAELYDQVPSGVGKGGNIKLSDKEMNNMLEEGCRWAVLQGYASNEDLNFIESNGCMTTANPDFVSKIAKDRGRDQLGTMGAGNHFVEIDYIQKIYDEEVAKAFGLFLNQVVIQIHTGSRGLGHQVATDYIKKMIIKYLKRNPN